ncbi:hypothetical protein DY000_02011711 [Brassica cretica]|uniref:Uncharacterized protein n=1 Tax=Brassica cretica TaxID=69181 RepID=A0ABQ7D8Z2_BRACR|nr:hypothetical protein DY000_02011711 [Brassica cretica]
MATSSLLLADLKAGCCRNAVRRSTTAEIWGRGAERMRWPSLFEGVDRALEEWIIDQSELWWKLVIKVFYFSVVGDEDTFYSKIFSCRGTNYCGIVERWENMKLVIMEAWNEEDKRCFDRFAWKS